MPLYNEFIFTSLTLPLFFYWVNSIRMEPLAGERPDRKEISLVGNEIIQLAI
jgi:hypothetical protein